MQSAVSSVGAKLGRITIWDGVITEDVCDKSFDDGAGTGNNGVCVVLKNTNPDSLFKDAQYYSYYYLPDACDAVYGSGGLLSGDYKSHTELEWSKKAITRDGDGMPGYKYSHSIEVSAGAHGVVVYTANITEYKDENKEGSPYHVGNCYFRISFKSV